MCTICGGEKEEQEFPWKNSAKDMRHSHCRDCQRSMVKRHYGANKQYYLDKARRIEKAKTQGNQRYILAYLATHPCIDCGESDPVVLEFDHKRDKIMDVANLTRHGSLTKLMAEVEKCEIVCANCHRRRTAPTNSWYRFNNTRP